jgi:hypothetical protein
MASPNTSGQQSPPSPLDLQGWTFGLRSKGQSEGMSDGTATSDALFKEKVIAFNEKTVSLGTLRACSILVTWKPGAMVEDFSKIMQVVSSAFTKAYPGTNLSGVAITSVTCSFSCLASGVIRECSMMQTVPRFTSEKETSRKALFGTTMETIEVVLRDLSSRYPDPARSIPAGPFPFQLRFRDIVLYRHFKKTFQERGLSHVKIICDNVSDPKRAEAAIATSFYTAWAGCAKLGTTHRRCAGCKVGTADGR